MACIDCERAAEAGEVYWFRWGAANIGIIGCRKDVTEVMNALRKALRAEVEEPGLDMLGPRVEEGAPGQGEDGR